MFTVIAYLRDECGAETVEWVVVVSALVTLAVVIFGPSGSVLANAIKGGINQIGAILEALPSGRSAS